jgi:hypothetical protein
MLQKFKITSYAFTVFCAVFMTLPVNTSAQNEGRDVVGRDESRAVDSDLSQLETADNFLQNLIVRNSETIEKMSETIAELESNYATAMAFIAAIEDDLEKQKVAELRGGGPGTVDIGEMRVDLTRILMHPSTGHLFEDFQGQGPSAASHTYAMKAHEHMKHSEMSETITELESKLAAIEDDLEKQKVAELRGGGTGTVDIGEMRVDLTRILMHPSTGHLSEDFQGQGPGAAHTYAMKAHEHMTHSHPDTTWNWGSEVRAQCQDGRAVFREHKGRNNGIVLSLASKHCEF